MTALPEKFVKRWLIPCYTLGLLITALYWHCYGASTYRSIWRLVLYSIPGPILTITTTPFGSTGSHNLAAYCWLAAYFILFIVFWKLRRFFLGRIFLGLLLASWTIIGALVITLRILNTTPG